MMDRAFTVISPFQSRTMPFDYYREAFRFRRLNFSGAHATFLLIRLNYYA